MKKNMLVCLVFVFLNVCVFAQNDNFSSVDFWKTATVADVQKELDNGADVNSREMPVYEEYHKDIEETVLMLASAHNTNPDVIELLLKNGADVNATDYGQGKTPLMYASESNRNPQVIEILIKYGANVNEESSYAGWTPLRIAVSRNINPKITETLLKLGADIHANNEEALFYACDNELTSAHIEVLLEYGANAGVKNSNGLTPLMLASQYKNNAQAVELLINHGANVHDKTDSGYTPLLYASGSSPEVIEMLLKHGAGVNVANKEGTTPLMRACIISYDPKIIETLLENGADLRVRDKDEKTALDYAKENKSIYESDVYQKMINAVSDSRNTLDYRQVIFGNSYEQIIEINAEQFLKQYPAVKNLDNLKELWENSGLDIDMSTIYYRAYEQRIGDRLVYRLIASFKKYTDQDFLDWKNAPFTQYVFYWMPSEELVQLGEPLTFAKPMLTQTDWAYAYSGLEIIERDNRVIGFMTHKLLSHVPVSMEETLPRVYSNTAKFFTWDAVIYNYTFKSDSLYYFDPFHKDVNSVNISIVGNKSDNDVLVDSKRPFMYTLQNAFDGNPATSFVENSSSDVFGISFTNVKNANTFKIINGYADGTYYKENNQIKNITINNENFHLEDSQLAQEYTFSYKKNSPLVFEVTEITPGTKYNDTALAELDIKIDGIRWFPVWLFGQLK